MVRNAPLRERRWTLLALAQYQTGNQGEALRTIHQLKSVLLTQLGIDPAPTCDALEQSILRQDASLLSGAPSAPSASSCPWQGLRAYDVDDAERFFGRDDDVAACLDILRSDARSWRWSAHPGPASPRSCAPAWLAALRGTGPPGRHRDARADIRSSRCPRSTGRATTRGPARRPGRGGLRALRGPGRAPRLPRASSPSEAQLRPVLVAIRADRLADVTEHAGFSRLVEQGLHLVGALDEDGLRQRRRGTGTTGGADHRARPGRPAGPRGPRRPRSPAAAVTRPARDVEAARGQHPDRRRATTPPAGSTAPSPSPPSGSTRRVEPDQPTPAARPDAAPGLPGHRGRSRSAPGSPDGSSPPTPSTTS